MDSAKNFLKSEVEKSIIECLVKLQYEPTKDQSEILSNDLGMDSLDYVEFIMEVEKSLDIIIPDDIAEKYENSSVADFIEGVQNFLINKIVDESGD